MATNLGGTDPQPTVPSQITTTPTPNGRTHPPNTTDALTYLCLIKHRFRGAPEVYNRFLGVMREFKDQAIGTPGAIQEISVLFREHPDLIAGFNTFLPPGYHIEVLPNFHQDSVTVTPMNVLVQLPDGPIVAVSQDPPSL